MEFENLDALINYELLEYQQKNEFYQMTQSKLEKEIIRLYKKEKKSAANKTQFYHEVIQAIETLDKIKNGFIAHGSTSLKKLYHQTKIIFNKKKKK